MIPWELLGAARIPGDGRELRLYRRGDEYAIRVDNYELMNSYVHGSEEALAELACARIRDRSRPRVLIGGLGMGYTTAAALQQLGARALVVIAELVPAVVTWNRGPLAHLAGYPLEDRRVVVRETDVARVLKADVGFYDAILLDVDNGPHGLSSQDNDRLYGPEGLQVSHGALRPGGVLAIWSASPDRAFPKRLHKAGFDVEEIRVRARGARGGGRRTIWLAGRR
jgi:spermidine synthase